MATTTDTPKPTDAEAKALTEATAHAYGNKAADEFFDEVLESARRYEKVFSGEQTRTE